LSRASPAAGVFCSALFSSAICILQLIIDGSIRVLDKFGKQIS
jgi:hypothetical protein